MNELLTYIYVAVIGLAFISSLVSFRLDFAFHLKLVSVLLGITLLVECAAVTMIKVHHSNVPLYNIFMLLEFWVFGYYYKCILESRRIRRVISAFLVLFPVFWVLVVFFIFGITKWNSYVVIVGSFFIICFSAAYYYQVFTQDELATLDNSPEFWIATGLIIFYACNLPYMGMLNFLVKNYLGLAVKFLSILKILNVIMYSIFIYAFLCRIIIKKSS